MFTYFVPQGLFWCKWYVLRTHRLVRNKGQRYQLRGEPVDPECRGPSPESNPTAQAVAGEIC